MKCLSQAGRHSELTTSFDDTPEVIDEVKTRFCFACGGKLTIQAVEVVKDQRTCVMQESNFRC